MRRFHADIWVSRSKHKFVRTQTTIPTLPCSICSHLCTILSECWLSNFLVEDSTAISWTMAHLHMCLCLEGEGQTMGTSWKWCLSSAPWTQRLGWRGLDRDALTHYFRVWFWSHKMLLKLYKWVAHSQKSSPYSLCNDFIESYTQLGGPPEARSNQLAACKLVILAVNTLTSLL